MKQYLITEKQLRALTKNSFNAGVKWEKEFPSDSYNDWYENVVKSQLHKLPKVE